MNAWSTGGRPLLAKSLRLLAVSASQSHMLVIRRSACGALPAEMGYWYLRSTWGPFWLGEHKGGVPSFDPPVTEGADDLVDAVK